MAPTNGQIAFAALTPTDGSDLWQVAVGSAATLLQSCAGAFCATPAWSPDGRLLAFSQRNANEFGAAAISPPRLYLRDTYDHAVQVMDMAETFREIASGLMDLHLSSVSNKMNEIMKMLIGRDLGL